jgi:hypothetical protein
VNAIQSCSRGRSHTPARCAFGLRRLEHAATSGASAHRAERHFVGPDELQEALDAFVEAAISCSMISTCCAPT